MRTIENEALKRICIKELTISGTDGEGKLKDISQPTISEEESEVRLEGERRDDSKEVRDEPAESDEFILVTCDSCKVKNKVPSNKRFGLKCGKCGTPLKIGEVV